MVLSEVSNRLRTVRGICWITGTGALAFVLPYKPKMCSPPFYRTDPEWIRVLLQERNESTKSSVAGAAFVWRGLPQRTSDQLRSSLCVALSSRSMSSVSTNDCCHMRMWPVKHKDDTLLTKVMELWQEGNSTQQLRLHRRFKWINFSVSV